ncbi:MAG: hypothetical protein ABI647_14605 [Gemmatimonadota bacterium]
MNPELSGFALGLLFGAAKIMAIGTIGFGIAWWRARLRIRQLERDQLEPVPSEERMARLEQAFTDISGQLDQLIRTNTELNRRLESLAGHQPLLPPP